MVAGGANIWEANAMFMSICTHACNSIQSSQCVMRLPQERFCDTFIDSVMAWVWFLSHGFMTRKLREKTFAAVARNHREYRGIQRASGARHC